MNSSVIVEKPIPYTFDLGNLLVNDMNPLPQNPTSADITAASRDCAQGLINQLLTTCPIKTSSAGDLVISLPQPTTPLPREKPLPTPKGETKWERFARKRGIQDKKREGKMVYDEASGEWVPRYGYKGANKKGENDWLVEVDEKEERKAEEQGRTVRGMKRAERKESVKRNERKQRSNDRNHRKNHGSS